MRFFAKARFKANWAFFRDLHIKVTVAIVSNRLGLVDLIFYLIFFGDAIFICHPVCELTIFSSLIADEIELKLCVSVDLEVLVDSKKY